MAQHRGKYPGQRRCAFQKPTRKAHQTVKNRMRLHVVGKRVLHREVKAVENPENRKEHFEFPCAHPGEDIGPQRQTDQCGDEKARQPLNPGFESPADKPEALNAACSRHCGHDRHSLPGRHHLQPHAQRHERRAETGQTVNKAPAAALNTSQTISSTDILSRGSVVFLLTVRISRPKPAVFQRRKHLNQGITRRNSPSCDNTVL